VIVLGVGYGIYSIDLEGYPLLFLSIFTSGSNPVNFVETNKLVPLTNTFKFFTYLPASPTEYEMVALRNLK
jgi:hypothetical protein